MSLVVLGAAFSLGLVTGLHCVGMCGPLALALPVVGKTRPGYVAGRLLYNLGRAVTYAMMGLCAGFIGQSLSIGGFQRTVSVAAGTFILLGLLLAYLGVLPWLMEQLGVWFLFGKLQQLWRKGFANRGYTGLFVLGLINGLLPCGPVYVALAGAVATASIPEAGVFMLVFGLGTLPMMLAVSLAGKLIQMPLRRRLQKLLPVSAAVVALLLILRGMALGIPYISPPEQATRLGGDPASCCHGNDSTEPVR